MEDYLRNGLLTFLSCETIGNSLHRQINLVLCALILYDEQKELIGMNCEIESVMIIPFGGSTTIIIE
jgi:hypothetical protein